MTDLFNRLDFYISLLGIALVLYLWGRRWWRSFWNTMSTPPVVRSKRMTAVLPDTVALEPPPPPRFGPLPNWVENRSEPTIDLVTLGQIDRETLIDVLSVLKKDGEYLLSANKILELVGGTAAEVKARVTSHRPKPPAPKVSGRLDRPANGW